MKSIWLTACFILLLMVLWAHKWSIDDLDRRLRIVEANPAGRGGK